MPERRKYKSRPLTQRPFAAFFNSHEGRWLQTKITRLAVAAVARRKRRSRRRKY